MSRKAIKDEFTDLPLSRQRKWQLRRRRAGLCIICGKPVAPGLKGMCVEHCVARRENLRKLFGLKTRYLNSPSYQAEALLKAGKLPKRKPGSVEGRTRKVWSPKEEALLGKAPDKDVARRTGRTLLSVRSRRSLLKIPIFTPGTRNRKAVPASRSGHRGAAGK